MSSYCFVPGCKSSRNSKRWSHVNGQRLSLFTPPSDEVKFAKWQRMIPKRDRPLQRSDRICHLHFMPEHIISDFVHVIRGETVKIPRSRATLHEDAYPCIFPGLPKYFTKIPKTRKPPAKRNSTVSIKPFTIDSNKDVESKDLNSPAKDDSANKTDPDVYCGLNLDEFPKVKNNPDTFSLTRLIAVIDDIRLPSLQWAKHIVSNKSIVFSHVSLVDSKFVTDKILILDETLQPTFSNGVSTVLPPSDRISLVQSVEDVEEVIKYFDTNRICCGIISVSLTEGHKEINVKKVHDQCQLFLGQMCHDLCENCFKEKQRTTRSHNRAKRNSLLKDAAKHQLIEKNHQLQSAVAQLTKNTNINRENNVNGNYNDIEVEIGNYFNSL